MPLFGLLPYDDEEEERKRRMLTPPINPNEPAPNIPMPTRRPALPMAGPEITARAPRGAMLPPPATGIPGGERTGMLGPVGPRPLTRPEQLEEERHVYQAGTPTRGRSALRGAFEGLASGGLGGAITGAIYGAADPAGLRRRRFEREEKPRLFEQFAMEDAEAERQRRQQAGDVDLDYKRAQIGALNRSNLPRPLPLPRPFKTDRGTLGPDGKIIPGTEPLPPQPRQSTPHYVFDTDGKPYDLDNLEERKRFESLPRHKRVKPEKAASRGAKKTPKTFTVEDVDAAVAETGLSELRIKQRFIENGYREVK